MKSVSQFRFTDFFFDCAFQTPVALVLPYLLQINLNFITLNSKLTTMALSRIWCAFIIIAISIASFKYFFLTDNNKIFSQLVVGKKADTAH